jgi:hypothetical protein
MKRSLFARLSLAAISLGALGSCAAPTQLTTSWADPASANHSYKKVVVVGVTPQASTRRTYEDAFAAELQSRGVTAVASYSFAGEGQIDKDQAIAKLKEVGADAVIVTRLVDKETVETYYPPTYSTVAAPSAYYGGWYGYYSMGYSYMSSPGYVAQDKVFRIETNLYDVEGDKLMWSGLTETTLSTDTAPETEIRPFIATLVADMEAKKVVPKRMKS